MSDFDGMWKKVGVTNVDGILGVAFSGESEARSAVKAFLEMPDQVEDLFVDGRVGRRKFYMGGKLVTEDADRFDEPENRDGLMGKCVLRHTLVTPHKIDATETAADGRVCNYTLRVIDGKLYHEYEYKGQKSARIFEKIGKSSYQK